MSEKLMAPKFIKYLHHGNLVWVRTDLVGTHRQHCLCYSCKHFYPEGAENCIIAERVFSLCEEESLVLPVWECPKFEELEPSEAIVLTKRPDGWDYPILTDRHGGEGS